MPATTPGRVGFSLTSCLQQPRPAVLVCRADHQGAPPLQSLQSGILLDTEMLAALGPCLVGRKVRSWPLECQPVLICGTPLYTGAESRLVCAAQRHGQWHGRGQLRERGSWAVPLSSCFDRRPRVHLGPERLWPARQRGCHRLRGALQISGNQDHAACWSLGSSEPGADAAK